MSKTDTESLYKTLIRQHLERLDSEEQDIKDEIISRLTKSQIKNPIFFSAGRILMRLFVDEVAKGNTPDPRLIKYAARSFALILAELPADNALGLIGKKPGNPNKQRKPPVLDLEVLKPTPDQWFVRNDNETRIRNAVKLLVDVFGGQKKKAMIAVVEETGYSYEQVKNFCKGI